MPFERKLGFNILMWADGGLRYFVVGDAIPSDIRDLSTLLKNERAFMMTARPRCALATRPANSS